MLSANIKVAAWPISARILARDQRPQRRLGIAKQPEGQRPKAQRQRRDVLTETVASWRCSKDRKARARDAICAVLFGKSSQ